MKKAITIIAVETIIIVALSWIFGHFFTETVSQKINEPFLFRYLQNIENVSNVFFADVLKGALIIGPATTIIAAILLLTFAGMGKVDKVITTAMILFTALVAMLTSYLIADYILVNPNWQDFLGLATFMILGYGGTLVLAKAEGKS